MDVTLTFGGVYWAARCVECLKPLGMDIDREKARLLGESRVLHTCEKETA